MSKGAGLQYLESLPASVIQLGLDRIKTALAALDHPQRRVPALHVAGTNGKGSVCAVAAACLGQAFRVGRYTSPHLTWVTERIAVDGRDITEAELDARILEVRAALPAELPLTYFELGTVVAFHHFAMKRVDVAVLETGLGGRLDATTACEPRVCVLTPIGFDHQAFLGDTLQAIAFEKAGILEPGVPAVCARQPPEAMAVIRRQAQELRAPLWVEGEDFHVTAQDGAVDYRGPSWRLDAVPQGLTGAHQAQNLGVALAALEVLSARGFALSDAQVREGCRRTFWPGRLESFGAAPEVVLDGAHNLEGVEALVAALPGLAKGRAVHLVFGAAQDKPVEAMLGRLLPHVASATFAPIPSDRTVAASVLEELATRLNAPAEAADKAPISTAADLSQALDRARSLAGPGGLVLAAGSLYLVGALRPLLQQAARIDRSIAPVTLPAP